MSSKLWTEEQFNCPVCLDLPLDPVTIPCGHSYCMECINDYWGKDDHIGIYSCPQCRQTFCPRPHLCRNTMLAEAVEQLRRASLNPRGSIKSVRRPSSSPGSSMAPASSSSSSSSGAVPCDVCQTDPQPAVKTCLVCLASYCETHLKPHRQAPALKRHELIGPTGQLTQKICAQHKYLQEFYCKPCQAFVCWLCTSNQHKGHETCSTQAERTERQKEMGEVQGEIQLKLQEREKELKEMKNVVETLKRSADRVHADNEKILTELQRSVERLQELVEEVMDSRGQDKIREAQEVVGKLESEIADLKRKDTEMRQLVNCEDNIHFLQNFKALCTPVEGGDLPGVTANLEASFEPVCVTLLDLRDKVEEMCNQELSQITKTGETNTRKHTHLPTYTHLLAHSTCSQTPLQDYSPAHRLTLESQQGFTLGDKAKNAPRPKFEFFKSKLLQAPLSLVDLMSHSVYSHYSDTAPQLPEAQRDECQTGDRKAHRGPHETHTGESKQRAMESQPAVQPLPVAQPSGVGGIMGQHGVVAGNLYLPAQPTELANTAGQSSCELPSGYTCPNHTPVSLRRSAGAMTTAAMAEQGKQIPGVSPHYRWQKCYRKRWVEWLSKISYASRLTLDPATAHRRLCLTEGYTKATLQGATQPYPDLPARFDSWTQVLCRDALSADRCYWEVEWRGRGSAVGVAYAAMARKGADARAGLGYNALSWSLELSDTCCAAMHHNEKHDITVGYTPRVGVYVDRKAGILSFYSVSDSMALLHTFQTGFVEPLFPAFGVGSGVGVGLDFALGQFSSMSDSIKICPI
ncbi:hypothetical protein JZ751_009214 [Albula glossodonta]|uniref:Tripartite motif containing 25, like n=1 Tax=Albula glossodonta TaxID=121402 RepID=A0A8T2N653_9TELE|nr:hypothetical protein JZ751_009214 [Albula glossodonta]